MLPPTSPDMGDHDAPHEAHECDCSVHNAMEMHTLVCALAEEHGVDLCDEPPDGDEPDDIMNLRLIHDLSMSQGAHCDYDGPDDEGDSGDEFDVSRFSDEDGDGEDRDDDTGDDDTDEIDIIDLDGIGDDDDESFSDGLAGTSADLVTTPPFEFA